MKRYQGSIGIAEGAALAVTALFIGGVFAVDPKFAYQDGNSTYLTIPLAVILSLTAAVFCINACENTGSKDLAELFKAVFGRIGGVAAAALLSAAFVLAASKPLTCFLTVLHRLVYDGASYWTILAFIYPVILIMAWKGFETLGRMAAVFSGIVFLSAAAAIVSAIPSFETYRLYPLLSGSTAGSLSFTGYETLMLLPPISALLINARGLNGIGYARRIACISGAAAALICGLAQLAVSLVYPYKVLSGLLMPLYRINYLSLSQSYALRLDKLFVMIWLTGALISSAYLIYSPALLIAETAGIKNVRWPVAAISLAVFAVVPLGLRTDFEFTQRFLSLERKYGFMLALLPIAAAALVGALKKKGKK